MTIRRNTGIVLLVAAAVAAPVRGAEPAGNAEKQAAALLTACGIRGGICLVVGAEDTQLAEALARQSALYVQQLEPDADRAMTFGRRFATSRLRERLGIRHAVFAAEDYASNAINLVVLTSWSTKIGSGLSGAARVVVPGGRLAVRGPPAELKAAARAAELEMTRTADGWAILRKAATRSVVRPCDSLRWRAGSRWQRIGYHDFCSVCFGDGKLLYRETVAAAGGGWRFELVCRDAYNGRTLWKTEEPPFSPNEWSRTLRDRMGAAIDQKGRVYVGLGDDLVCLDADNGNRLSTVAEGGRPRGRIVVCGGRFLIAGGVFRDLEDGKELGRYSGRRIAVGHDAVYATDHGRTITAYRIPDGKVLWRVDARKDQPTGQFSGMFRSDMALHVHRSWPAASLSTMDPKTGKTLWTWPPPPRPKVRDVLAYPFGNKLYIAYNDKTVKQPHDFVFMAVEAASGKVLRRKITAEGKKWAGGCWAPRRAGEYLVYHHNCWFHTRTAQRTYLLMFRPKCRQGPLPENGMLYGFPGRKGGAIKGIAALGPRDIDFNQDPGGGVLKEYGRAHGPPRPRSPSEWPMFRGKAVRGNSVKTSLGKTLRETWQATVGLGKQTYGVMDAERTGLTQAVCAAGLVVVAEIEGQRVVALSAETGKITWTFHVGSRVDFPPALHEGLCLFAAQDGWAYCLDARTGALVYKLLVAPRERYIGGQEKLESLWPGCGDVLVVGGLAYSTAGLAASIHGGIRAVAFRPRTGQVIWARCITARPSRNDGELQPNVLVHNPGRKRIRMGRLALDPASGKSTPGFRDSGHLHLRDAMEDWLSTNNRDRLSEDMGGVTIDDGRDGIKGRLIAFTDSFGVGFNVLRTPKTGLHTGSVVIAGKSRDGKTSWALPPTEMNVDDLLLTRDAVYCVGHYEKGARPAELWVISPQDGKVVGTHTIKGFPAYNGMSAAGKRLFIATREGRLLCFEGN